MSILSARKDYRTIKKYIEWLYALISYKPERHFDFARYKKRENPYEATFHTTNTGVPISTIMRCGDNPYLEATLAKNVTLTECEGKMPLLKWSAPDRQVFDESTPWIIKEKIPGVACQAFVHLPLCIMNKSGVCEEP